MTTETKLKFFACNIGQKLHAKSGQKAILNPYYLEYMSRHEYEFDDVSIIKTPLDKITDEDALEFVKLFSPEVEEITLISGVAYYDYDFFGHKMETTTDFTDFQNMCFPINAYQYLHARGYALPFTTIENGKPVTYSVQQLVDNDLIILK